MADYCDEFYATLSRTQPRARKAHKCDECGREIAAGETYDRYVGVMSGYRTGPETWRTCAHCVVARGWIETMCGGRWVFGCVLDDLLEHWQEEDVLRSIWLGKAIIGMRRRWQCRGVLVSLLEPFANAHG